jgi:O-acetylserine/cysteine efflux transporter
VLGQLAQDPESADVEHSKAQLTLAASNPNLSFASRAARLIAMRPAHALLAVLVAVAWGVNFVVIHVGLDSFPPLLFAALRFTITALPAVLIVGKPRVPWRTVLGVGAFMSAGQFGLLFVAIDQGLPAGLASLVLQLQAVFTIALAVAFLGERPGRAQLGGAAVALAGIGVIAAGRTAAVPLFAIALCVAAGASWGIGNVIMRKARPPAPLSLIVWASLVPPLPLAALSLSFEGTGEWSAAFTQLDASGLLALAYIVVVSTFFGYGSWALLMGRYPASTVAPFTLLVPVVGIAAAWVALAETPGAAELIGAAIVLVGLALTTGAVTTARAGRRSPQTAASAGTSSRPAPAGRAP